jgi:hypothetical protein
MLLIPVMYGRLGRTVGVGFVKATSDGRCRDFTAPMSAFGGKADLRGTTLKSPLIAKNGHCHLLCLSAARLIARW